MILPAGSRFVVSKQPLRSVEMQGLCMFFCETGRISLDRRCICCGERRLAA